MINKKEKITAILRSRPNIEFAYLFGSRAKGIAKGRSDWDVAIYFQKDPQKQPYWTVFNLEAEISKAIREQVQITVLNNLDSSVFLFQIIKDGLLLLDNNTEKRISWEAHVLKQYHDWQFFLKRHMTSKI